MERVGEREGAEKREKKTSFPFFLASLHTFSLPKKTHYYKPFLFCLFRNKNKDDTLQREGGWCGENFKNKRERDKKTSKKKHLSTFLFLLLLLFSSSTKKKTLLNQKKHFKHTHAPNNSKGYKVNGSLNKQEAESKAEEVEVEVEREKKRV